MLENNENTTAALASVERPHHKYGMSKLQPLDACAAYDSQSGTNAAAEEGTYFHSLMDDALALVVAKKEATSLSAVRAILKKLPVPLTDVEAGYLEYCAMKVDKFLAKSPKSIRHEIRVAIKNPDGTELNHGYLDLVLEWETYAIVIDYKFGWAPVTPASNNLQGMGYCLAYLMDAPIQITRVGACFIQPKINYISEHVWTRMEAHNMYSRIREVIARAEEVTKNPEIAQRYMRPGKHCDYCSRRGACAVLANHAGIIAQRYGGLPQPSSFMGMELSKPEDFALARYWADCVEKFAEEVKKKAYEAALANGGELTCTLRDGSVIRYSMEERGADRKLGTAADVAGSLQALGLSVEQVMGAADLKLGKLEAIVSDAMVQIAKAEERKLTKKRAWETACQLLESEGLLTRDETKIKYLKLEKVVIPAPAQLEEKTETK